VRPRQRQGEWAQGETSFSAAPEPDHGLHVLQGTFSNRHAIISDQEHVTRSTVPLQSLTDSPPHGLAKDGVSPGTIEIVNSPLSEYAVVGYEQGVAYASPDILPLWEAQVRACAAAVVTGCQHGVLTEKLTRREVFTVW
jgi:2-oxoglutarate dehydrogenase complex dehydrogenase (E1) component-like enzyme